MSADGPRALHPPLRSNDYFDFHLADHVHALGKFRIYWRDLGFGFSFAFLRRPRLRQRRTAQDRQQRCARERLLNPTGSYRHLPSYERDVPAVRKERRVTAAPVAPQAAS